MSSLSDGRKVYPTPAYEKERQGYQCGTHGRKEEKAKGGPDTDQRHSQRRLHGMHAHSLAHSGYLVPLSHHAVWSGSHLPLLTWRGRLVAPPLILRVNGAQRADHQQREERAEPYDVVQSKFHCHLPVSQT